MLKTIRGLSVFGAALAAAGILGFAGAAHAASRVFIAPTGNDANICNLLAPCRTFQRGIDMVDDGGEVVVLDSAGYGPMTITNKGVAIVVPPGLHAGITAVSGGDGVVIDAANKVILLNGMVIGGNGIGATGIKVIAGHSIVVNRSRVGGFTTGISFAVPAGSTGSGPTISLTDSFVGFSSANGIEISGTSGTNSVGGSIVNSQFMRNAGTAIVAGDRSRVTVANSVINNNQNAVRASATSTFSRLYVASSAVTNVAEVAVKAGPAGTGNAFVTLCDNSINYVSGSTGTAFLRDPDASCDATTCRIFSCGNILFGLPAVLENPTGVVEPIGAANGPITK